MTKPIEDSFADWESSTFGFGYGSGEEHIIPALRRFLELCTNRYGNGVHSYDFRELEEALGPTVAWLLINVLGHADMIEYGCSPRFAWLTKQGHALREFMLSKTVDELYAMTCRDQDYVGCMPNVCNCGPDGYQAGVICDNPFWNN